MFILVSKLTEYHQNPSSVRLYYKWEFERLLSLRGRQNLRVEVGECVGGTCEQCI